MKRISAGIFRPVVGNRPMRFSFMLLFATIATNLAAAPPPAVTSPAAQCERAIAAAEYTGRLPARMLTAIAEAESGRPDPATGALRPWPWTINAEGEGHYFSTRQEAIAAVRALQARGVVSIDVGCLQVNLMYHPDAFASLDDAFDPGRNALYAGRFLNSLYAGSHNWPQAIGAYHSETPALGDAYRALVMARWQRADPRAVAAPTAPVAYGAFADPHQVYAAFAPASAVYGAFATVAR